MHLATCQRTQGFSIASGVSASSSAAPMSSSGPTLLKTKATAGRGPRPSPRKKQVAFQVPYDDEASNEELALLRDEMGQHMTLTRGQRQIRHWSVWILMP